MCIRTGTRTRDPWGRPVSIPAVGIRHCFDGIDIPSPPRFLNLGCSPTLSLRLARFA
jgi:hypothetical protein